MLNNFWLEGFVHNLKNKVYRKQICILIICSLKNQSLDLKVFSFESIQIKQSLIWNILNAFELQKYSNSNLKS